MATQVGTKLAFCDTETTGLDPDRHEIWEVGLILREEDGRETQHHWFLPVDLGRADAFALNIGHFHERHPDGGGVPKGTDVYTTFLGEFARDFADLTRGAHLVGAVVSFDAERLTKLLRANGACPEWHYHLIDVEALAVGYIYGRASGLEASLLPGNAWAPMALPWNSDALSRLLGVEPPGDSDRHTAFGDALWARDLFDGATALSAPTASQRGENPERV